MYFISTVSWCPSEGKHIQMIYHSVDDRLELSDGLPGIACLKTSPEVELKQCPHKAVIRRARQRVDMLFLFGLTG